MERGVNPWTGKSKTSKNGGLFNDILFKHYPELQTMATPNPYLELLPIIQSQTNDNRIDEYKEFFDLKTKLRKMVDIIEWVNKVEKQAAAPLTSEEVPINSSFVYLPIHSYATFHQILKDCVGATKEPIMREQTVQKVKSELADLEATLKMNELIIKSIL